MTPTNFRKPKTGDELLRVRFRNGLESRWEYTAAQLRWDDRGSPFDIVACERADTKREGSSARTASGSYA